MSDWVFSFARTDCASQTDGDSAQNQEPYGSVVLAAPVYAVRHALCPDFYPA